MADKKDEEPTEQPQEPMSEVVVSPEEHEARRKRIMRLKQELVGDLLTTAEVAEILEVHPRTVGEYIKDGRLSAINLGGGWKVSEDDLRFFVRQARPKSEPDEEVGGSNAGDVFSRMTAQARKVIVEAQTEARAMNHDYIGTEHLLLAVLGIDGAGRTAMEGFGLDEQKAKEQVLKHVKMGDVPVDGRYIPFTPAAKKVLELTLKQALRMGSKQMTPEHILLALIEEGTGVAANVIDEMTPGLEVVATKVRQIMSDDGANP